MATTNKRFVAKNGIDNNGNTITNVGASGNSLGLSGTGDLTVAISGTATLTVPATTDTLVTLASIQTLTNKTISGADNTLTNIGNGSLTNSSITINGTSVSLGGTRTLVTDDIAEDGSPVNLWFTDTRSRAAISVTDSGGDGSLAYDSGTGVITYTGPSASEVRAHFSAGTGVTITSGQVAIGQAVATTDNVSFAGVTADNIRVGVTGTNEIDTSAGNLTIDSTGGTTVMDDDVNVTGNLQIDGNLTVSGTTVTVNATNLAVEDNMIYLNNGSAVANPDLGFAGNYNDGTYRHAGIFRDASDGVWKFFHEYTPEPDASAYIDITHGSFALAPIQASAVTATTFTGSSLTVSGDLTVDTSTLKVDSTNNGVGIGTTSLATNYPLTIRSQVADYTKIMDWGTAAGGSWGNMTINTSSPYETIMTSGGWKFDGGNFAVDTNTLYVDATNNRVGIGTTNPANKLQIGSVGSSGYGGNDFVIGNGTQVMAFYNYSGGPSAWFTNTHFALLSSGAGSTGNVGIGTTDPSTTTLSVLRGTSGEVGRFRTSATDSVADLVLVNDAQTWGFRVDGATSDNFVIRNFQTSTDVVHIKTSGNVGIGTTSPVNKLDIYDSVGATTLRLLNLYGVSTGLYGYSRIIGLTGGNGLFLSQNVSGSSGGNNPLDDTAQPGQAISIGQNYGGIAFVNYSAGAGTRTANVSMFINNSGNVGIGTTNPSEKLHVNGANATIGIYDPTISVGGNKTYIKMGYNSNYIAGLSSYVAAGKAGVDRVNLGFHVTTYTTSTQTFYEAMTITDIGNVGIGTTNPSILLHVKKAAIGDWIAAFDNTGTSPYGVRVDTSANSSTNYSLAVYTAAGTGFYVKNDGSVGIGITDPASYSAKLTVAGNVAASAGNNLRVWESTNTTYVQMNSPASREIRWTNDAGTEYMRINASGNVGIGTASPDYRLTILTPTSDATIGFNLRAYATGADGDRTVISRYTSSNNNNWAWSEYHAWAHIWKANGVEQMRLNSSGNVGIGTTNPGSYKLYVQGDQYISGTLTEASSIVLKENINPITDALSIISNLTGYTYDRKDGTAKNQAGLIAEEVEQTLPNVVSYDSDGHASGVQYTKIIAYLVESIKELKKELDSLRK